MDKKGGVSLVMFHCIYNKGAITHFLNEFDTKLSCNLENTYAVCIANNDDSSKKKIVGGFILKTSYTHKDQPEFSDICFAITQQKQELSKLINKKTTFLPAVIKVPMGVTPLTEDEMLQIMLQQFVKYSVEGNG